MQEAVASGVLSISHRSRDYSRLHSDTTLALRHLLDIPEDYHVWFLGSATEAMERIIQNTVASTSHHLVAGAFAAKFADTSFSLGKLVSIDEVEWGDSFDLDTIDVPAAAELIAITVNETSTGTHIDPASITRLHERYPDHLIAVDLVSAVPYVQIDFRAVDCAFFSVQKGFGLPAGLGVLVASPRAMARSRQLQAAGSVIGSYHSFPELAKWEEKHQTPETPNVLAIYLLGAVARDLTAYGIDRLRTETTEQATAIYDYFDRHSGYTLGAPNPAHRSQTVIVAAPTAGVAPVMDALSARGFKLGKGYGKQKDTHFRIANFPAHLGHTDQLLSYLEDHSPA